MISQNTSPAALRKAAIMFASVCCTAVAVGVATPLLAAGSSASALHNGGAMTATATAQPSGSLLGTDANA